MMCFVEKDKVSQDKPIFGMKETTMKDTTIIVILYI